MVVGLDADSVALVHGEYTGAGKPRITRWNIEAASDVPSTLPKMAKEFHLGRYRCTTLLNPGEYQLLVIEAPQVPQDELKGAMRWRLKDLLDYHVDDAMIDVLDIPADTEAANRAHYMYAVAAKNELIQSRVKLFEDANIPLSVIDIPELAQRNIAALYEGAGSRGIALLHFGPRSGLLTINFRGELYLARRIELGHAQLTQAPEGGRDEVFGRVLLELQRTLDHFDRQFRYVTVSKLLFGPEPQNSGLFEFLSSNLDLPMQRVRLADAISCPADTRPESDSEWRLFHPIGAALRRETKAL